MKKIFITLAMILVSCTIYAQVYNYEYNNETKGVHLCTTKDDNCLYVNENLRPFLYSFTLRAVDAKTSLDLLFDLSELTILFVDKPEDLRKAESNCPIQIELSNGDLLRSNTQNSVFASRLVRISSGSITVNNKKMNDNGYYVMSLLRTYDIVNILVDGASVKAPEVHTADTFDAMCKTLMSKAGDKWQYGKRLSSTRINSSKNTAQKSPTPSRTEATTVAHTARVENLQVLQDQKVNGEYGISFNMNTNIKGARGRKCDVIIFFYNKDGKPLKDFNGKYCTKDGSVCAWKDITPSYDNSSWEGMNIFIPYSELHMTGSGTSDIMYILQVRDLSEEKREGEKMVMYNTEKTIITIPLRPEVKLNKVWVDYNIRQQFSNGLLIHAYMEANNLKNKKLTFSVKFYKADNKTKLTDIFGNHISRETTFTPEYDGTVWKDFQFFIPYIAMNYASDKSGLYSLDVEILDRNGNVLRRWENIPLQRLY